MGQIGMNKGLHLQVLRDLCVSRGKNVDAVFSVGDLMYQESLKAGKPVQEGKILDLPLAELAVLRRLAFTRISYESAQMQNVFVNSHAVFRWNNQLFRAFELSELEGFGPDMIITLVDDVEAIKLRLDRLKESGLLPKDTKYSLQDLLVWREEEILAADMLASVLRVPHYVLGVWLEPEVTSEPLEVAMRLIFEGWRKRAYISYPISDAQVKPDIWEKVVRFRKLVASHLAAFDPLMIGERGLRDLLVRQRTHDADSDSVVCEVRGEQVQLSLKEIEAAVPYIDGQIVARDYKLVDQAEMIVAYFPLDVDGGPLIAGGVQSEIEHAAASTKEVVVLWESPKDPTPFIGQRVDRKFSDFDELARFLKDISKPTGQLELWTDSH